MKTAKRRNAGGGERPTGIVRALPSLRKGSKGRRRYEASLAGLERGLIPAIYIALQHKPRVEVLHIYLLIEGRIDVRLNVAGYVPGEERECWDESIRRPNLWAECTGPVSRPPEPIKMRGNRGFTYTGTLW
jgi:hypothetical protein